MDKPSKPKRRKFSSIRMAVPALSEWAPQPGQQAEVHSPFGDPAETTTDLSKAYLLPSPFPLQPIYFANFLSIEPLDKEEATTLSNKLSKELSPVFVGELKRSINRFVATVALARRFPEWRDFEHKLRRIIELARIIEESTAEFSDLAYRRPDDEPIQTDVMSAEQTVRHYLLKEGNIDDSRIILNITPVVRACEDALAIVGPRASKRGRKSDEILRLFLQRVVTAAKDAGVENALPTNEADPEKLTPFFTFVREILDLAVRKGISAANGSSLSAEEKSYAVRTFSHYNKTDRTLLHYLRELA